mmetsp:Transcript_27722/g.49552  ORF Transcript_27722/g.49552 Transcript_27722/m.49552 type:complete len:326 (-) Transcript_27722:362-1339(-)
MPAGGRLEVDDGVEVLQGRLVVPHVAVDQTSSLVQSFVGGHATVERLQSALELTVCVAHDAKVKPRGMMLGIFPKRLLVARDGISNRTTALVCQALVVEVGGNIGLYPDGLPVVQKGVTVLAELKVGIAPVEVNRCVVRLRLQGSREVSRSLLVLFEVVARQATVVQIPGARVDLNCVVEALPGLFKRSLLHVGETKVVVSVGRGRVQVDGLLEVLNGLCQHPNLSVANSAMKNGLVRRRQALLKGLLEALDGLVVLLQVYVNQRTLKVILRSLSKVVFTFVDILFCPGPLQAERLVVVPERVLNSSQASEAQATVAVVPGGAWV